MVLVATYVGWAAVLFLLRPARFEFPQPTLVLVSTVGLVAASAMLIAEASDHEWILVAITAGCAITALTTRLHPLWLLAAGALIGLSGIGLP